MSMLRVFVFITKISLIHLSLLTDIISATDKISANLIERADRQTELGGWMDGHDKKKLYEN